MASTGRPSRRRAGTRRAIDPSPATGRWTSATLREAFWSALAAVAADPAVKADPPVAISFSSSGREVFPVAADGTPLGPCLMTADTRGDDVAAETAARRTARGVVAPDRPRPATDRPGQSRPVVARDRPGTAAQTRWFMNWHEYYALLLSGRPVVDWSDAGTWATYDVATAGWSAERIAGDGHRSGLAARDPAERAPRSARSCPSRGQGRPAVHHAHRDGRLRHLRRLGGVGRRGPRRDRPLGRHLAPVQHAGHAGWPVELVHAGLNVFPHPGRPASGSWSRTRTGRACRSTGPGRAGP